MDNCQLSDCQGESFRTVFVGATLPEIVEK